MNALEAMAMVTAFVQRKARGLPYGPSRVDLLMGCPLVERDHAEDWRVHAHTLHLPRTICVAGDFEGLGDGHKLGVLFHEFGHLYGGSGEADADLWVEEALGIDLDYVDTIQYVEPWLLGWKNPHTPGVDKLYAHLHVSSRTGDAVFADFARSTRTVDLYGRGEEIWEVELRPVAEGEQSIYWAWWEDDKGYSMVFPSKSQFSMCFAYGYESSEQKDLGVAVNVAVTPISRVI